jgi:hypothetical protein
VSIPSISSAALRATLGRRPIGMRGLGTGAVRDDAADELVAEHDRTRQIHQLDSGVVFRRGVALAISMEKRVRHLAENSAKPQVGALPSAKQFENLQPL